jgi:hypothetical protein
MCNQFSAAMLNFRGDDSRFELSDLLVPVGASQSGRRPACAAMVGAVTVLPDILNCDRTGAQRKWKQPGAPAGRHQVPGE